MSDNSPENAASPGQVMTNRSQVKRSLILDAAMRHFANHGYEGARVGDMADQLGIAKGSVFQHFGSKDGLFFEAYKTALRSLPPYLDVPPAVKDAGFFAVVRYRLAGSSKFLEEYGIPYRIVLLGNYGSDLTLKKRITQFVASDDPLGTAALVKLGLDRGEIRTDVDPFLITSFLECTFERMHDFLLTAEAHPELFRRASDSNGNKQRMIDHFIMVLRGAIGTPQAS